MNAVAAFKKLEVLQDGFCWRGAFRRFDEVESIYWLARKVDVRRNYFHSHDEFYSHLKVCLKDETQISLRADDSDDLFDSTRKAFMEGYRGKAPLNPCEELWKVYSSLASATFSSRFSKYLDQLTKIGGFKYEGAEIALAGTIKLGKHCLQIRDCEIRRVPFAICFANRSSKRSEIVSFLFGADEIGFATCVDEDIFLFLLAEHWGIRFGPT
jgi:hypothetical protein